MNTFGDKIYSLRRYRCISQDVVAAAVGSTKSTISKYERNIVDPTLESAKKIAEYFNVSLDWLAGGEESTEAEMEEEMESEIFESYTAIIKKAIKQNITAENLDDALNLIVKIKNS